MNWYFGTGLTIFANVVFAVGYINATQPMELNHQAMASVFELFPWVFSRLETGVKSANDRLETSYQQSEGDRPKDNEFCTPEFEPIPLNQLSELPENRSIEEVEKLLGQPCKTDAENIYYVLNTGEIVYFRKGTGEGGFQS
jgi:hypothetical protein